MTMSEAGFPEGKVPGRGYKGTFWGAGNELRLLVGGGYGGGCTRKSWSGCTLGELYCASVGRKENEKQKMERMLYLAKFCNKYHIRD